MVRTGYPPEFRRRVLELVASDRKVRDVARDLGISEQSIYVWRRQERIDRGEEPGLSSEKRAELAAARRRIRELETEVAIHRRSTELLKTRRTQKRWAAISVMANEALPVEMACRILGVSESGYCVDRHRHVRFVTRGSPS